MAEAAAFLVPATAVPVTSEIRGILWHDDEVPDADVDDTLTAGAHVGLARLIRLYGVHCMVVQRTVKSWRFKGATGRR